MVTEGKNNIAADADYLASDLAKVLYKDQLSAVENTLERFRIPHRFYSILDIRDESVCLVYREGSWLVFMSEHGQETNVLASQEVEPACENLLRMMAESKEELSQMLFYFKEQIKLSSDKQVSSQEIYRAIKECLKKLSSSAAVF